MRALKERQQQVHELAAFAFFLFTELCLLTRAKRAASVVAVTYCTMFSLSDSDFTDVLRQHPAMRKALDAIVAEKRWELYLDHIGRLPI